MTQTYEVARRYAEDAVHFGDYYERQLRDNGNIKNHTFILPLEQLLSWVALAAIGGVICGASFELFKVVLKKIVSQFQQHPNKDKLPCIHILEDQVKVNVFLSYINDYYLGLKDVDKEVRNAIIHEMTVHEAVRIVEEEPNLKFPEDLEYLNKKAEKRAIDRINSRISEKDLKEIWKQIDISN